MDILPLNIAIGLCSILSNLILVYVICKARKYLNLSISVSLYIIYVLCIQVIPVYGYRYLLQAYEWMFLSIIATMIVNLIGEGTLILFARISLGVFSICSFLLVPLFSDKDIDMAISLLFLPHLIYLFVITYIIDGKRIYVSMFRECGIIILCKFIYLHSSFVIEESVNNYIMYRLFFNILPFIKYCYYMWILNN